MYGVYILKQYMYGVLKTTLIGTPWSQVVLKQIQLNFVLLIVSRIFLIVKFLFT